MTIVINIGCGFKTSAHRDVLNIDRSTYLRLRRRWVGRTVLAPLLLRSARRDKFNSLPKNILVHDLSDPLPLPHSSVDLAYHSHVLEHLDRTSAAGFLDDIYRVLKPGGLHRICVPDLEVLVHHYVQSFDRSINEPRLAGDHDDSVAALYEQSVRRAAFGVRDLSPIRRTLETALLGDARRRGETHQWMYDRVNLGALLESCGFVECSVVPFNESSFPTWTEYGLETDSMGGEYKPGSLYIECRRPD